MLTRRSLPILDRGLLEDCSSSPSSVGNWNLEDPTSHIVHNISISIIPDNATYQLHLRMQNTWIYYTWLSLLVIKVADNNLHFLNLPLLYIPKDNSSIRASSNQYIICVHGKWGYIMGTENVVLQMEGFLLLLKHDKILDFFFSGITTAASLIMLIFHKSWSQTNPWLIIALLMFICLVTNTSTFRNTDPTWEGFLDPIDTCVFWPISGSGSVGGNGSSLGVIPDSAVQ